jgi:hypothetical protein
LPDTVSDAEKSISTSLRWRNSQRADACALLRQRTSTKREPEIFLGADFGVFMAALMAFAAL